MTAATAFILGGYFGIALLGGVILWAYRGDLFP